MSDKPVTRLTDKTTGHASYRPRPAVEGSPNVFVNNLAANRVGDHWAAHVGSPMGMGDTHPSETTHTTSAGSSTVFANNKAVARIGDPVEGDTIAAGSPNVFAGD